jgi:hypothetical protein
VLSSRSRAVAVNVSGPSGSPATGTIATNRSGLGSVSVTVAVAPTTSTVTLATPLASAADTSIAIDWPAAKVVPSLGAAQLTVGASGSKGPTAAAPKSCGSALVRRRSSQVKRSSRPRPVPLAGVRAKAKIAPPRYPRSESAPTSHRNSPSAQVPRRSAPPSPSKTSPGAATSWRRSARS